MFFIWRDRKNQRERERERDQKNMLIISCFQRLTWEMLLNGILLAMGWHSASLIYYPIINSMTTAGTSLFYDIDKDILEKDHYLRSSFCLHITRTSINVIIINWILYTLSAMYKSRFILVYSVQFFLVELEIFLFIRNFDFCS